MCVYICIYLDQGVLGSGLVSTATTLDIAMVMSEILQLLGPLAKQHKVTNNHPICLADF